MIAVRDGGVATVLTMNMAFFMTLTVMLRSADIGIGCVYIQNMFIDMVAMHMVHVSIMKIIGMSVVNDGRVSAASTMLMFVTFVCFTGFCHVIDSRLGVGRIESESVTSERQYRVQW